MTRATAHTVDDLDIVRLALANCADAMEKCGIGVGPDGDYCIYCDWTLSRQWPSDGPTDMGAPFHRPDCALWQAQQTLRGRP